MLHPVQRSTTLTVTDLPLSIFVVVSLNVRYGERTRTVSGDALLADGVIVGVCGMTSVKRMKNQHLRQRK